MPASPLWILLHSWPTGFDRFIFRDIVVNIALYVPAGVTGHLAFRRFGKMWLSLVAPVVVGTLLSASIEMIQLFVPGRNTSAMDLTTNIAGTMLGVVLALVLEDVIERRRVTLLRRRPRRVPDRSALALLGCWIVWLWFPFFPVMGHNPLWRKIEIFVHAPITDAVPFLTMALAWFAAGSLFQAGALRPARRWTAISVGLVPAQLFILGQQPFPADLAGAIAGAACFAILWPLRKTRRDAYRRITAWTFLAVIVLRGLAPFQFSSQATPFSWLPFGGFLKMNWQTGVAVIAGKFFWYGAAIWLMRASGMKARTATAFVAVTLLGVEMAQTHLPGHVAEITDPIWAIFAGIAMVIIASHPKSAGREPPAD